MHGARQGGPHRGGRRAARWQRPPEAPAPAEYRNGAGGTLVQTEAAPVEAEATLAQETASTARTQATQDAAASRPVGDGGPAVLRDLLLLDGI